MPSSSFFRTSDAAAPEGPILQGIDIFHGDGAIKWSAMKSSGRFFCWLKATEGGDFQDVSFADNRNAANAESVINGAYHFFHPKTDVQLQIDNFCNQVGFLRVGDLPPVLDLEVPKEWKAVPGFVEAHMADWKSLTVDDRVNLVLTWCDAVEKRLGMRPVIYVGVDFMQEILQNDSRLAKFLLWLAWYNDLNPPTPGPWTKWTWHQYSEHGSVAALTSHELDLDRFDGSLEELKALCFGAQAMSNACDQPWYRRCPFTRFILLLLGL
jgi:lysozyme